MVPFFTSILSLSSDPRKGNGGDKGNPPEKEEEKEPLNFFLFGKEEGVSKRERWAGKVLEVPSSSIQMWWTGRLF